jgi:hypothetical protein
MVVYGQPAPTRRGLRPSDALVASLGAVGAATAERAAELLAGANVELGEHLAQVVLDSARADEQLGADLRVRLSLGGEPRDLRLLGGEDVTRLIDPLASGPAQSEQALMAGSPIDSGQLPLLAEYDSLERLLADGWSVD